MARKQLTQYNIARMNDEDFRLACELIHMFTVDMHQCLQVIYEASPKDGELYQMMQDGGAEPERVHQIIETILDKFERRDSSRGSR